MVCGGLVTTHHTRMSDMVFSNRQGQCQNTGSSKTGNNGYYEPLSTNEFIRPAAFDVHRFDHGASSGNGLIDGVLRFGQGPAFGLRVQTNRDDTEQNISRTVQTIRWFAVRWQRIKEHHLPLLRCTPLDRPMDWNRLMPLINLS